MFGIRFIKSDPTEYVIHSRNGALLRHGAGLSFFYYEPASSLAIVPLKSIDVPFVFNEVSSDFQNVVIQGQFSYRIAEPLSLTQLLDFSVLPTKKHRTEDPDLLTQRMTNLATVLLREVVCRLTLEEALRISRETARVIFERFTESKELTAMGIEVLDFTIVSVKPTPEMARALEAQTRELLQKRADEAIYTRRNAAVDQERMIKENELQTDIAVEEKRRLVREAKMAADVALEEQRTQLITQKAENDRKEADTRAYGLESMLKPLKEADWKVLTAAMSANMKPELMIATAFRELAENAAKIGELNMSPELLTSLMKPEKNLTR